MRDVNWMEGARDESRPNGEQQPARPAPARPAGTPKHETEDREPALARVASPKGA
jgi:nitrate reductase alpha subunit